MHSRLDQIDVDLFWGWGQMYVPIIITSIKQIKTLGVGTCSMNNGYFEHYLKQGLLETLRSGAPVDVGLYWISGNGVQTTKNQHQSFLVGVWNIFYFSIYWFNNGLTMVNNGMIWDLPSGKRLQFAIEHGDS